MSQYQELLKQHCALSGQILAIEDIRNHLIDQFHKTKGEKKRVKVHIPNPEAKKLYMSVLFAGNRTGLHLGNAYPHDVKDLCDSALFYDIPVLVNRRFDGIDLVDVYYSDGKNLLGEYKDIYFENRNFDKNEWSFTNQFHISQDDMETLKRFICQINDVFAEVQPVIARSKRPLEKPLIKYINHYKQLKKLS